MNSGVSYYIETSALLLVALSSLAVLALVVVVTRALGRRHDWSPGTVAAHTWSGSVAGVAVLCLALWMFVIDLGDGLIYARSFDDDRFPSGVTTLVWMPCVMALLWSVLHALRSGTGHPSPLLGVRPVLAVPLLWLVSAPLVITIFTVGVVGSLTWVGLLLWVLGQASVAMGRSWVGDVAVWAGIALVAADLWPGYVGLVSPVVVAGLVLLQRHRASGPRAAGALS